MSTPFSDIKRAFGAVEIRQLAEEEGLHRRGSGSNRSECPGCRDGDVRGVSIGERENVGVWKCQRDERHRGTAIDFLALARGIEIVAAAKLLEERAGLTSVPRRPSQVRPAPPPRVARRPPLGEVVEVWKHIAKPILDVPDVAALWRERGLDLAAIEDRDLARALPQGAAMPKWAFGGGAKWSEGPNRLLIPMFEAAGEITSLHARAARAPKGAPKGLSPLHCEIAGLVFADPLAHLVLAGRGHDLLRAAWLLIAEGGPDFLTETTRHSDADEKAPAVIGAIAGSWTEEIAKRVPDGARVLVAVHHDDAGDKYAAAIVRTLADRCEVRRQRRTETAA
jgi:hypothetical protein